MEWEAKKAAAHSDLRAIWERPTRSMVALPQQKLSGPQVMGPPSAESTLSLNGHQVRHHMSILFLFVVFVFSLSLSLSEALVFLRFRSTLSLPTMAVGGTKELVSVGGAFFY